MSAAVSGRRLPASASREARGCQKLLSQPRGVCRVAPVHWRKSSSGGATVAACFQARKKVRMKANRHSLGLGFAGLSCLAALLIFSDHLKARSAADSSCGFSLGNLDKTCKPCDNFYQFAMGGWMKANPIPPEYSSWGTFTKLSDNNLTALRTILEAAAKSTLGLALMNRRSGTSTLAAWTPRRSTLPA
jgi:hypothetical protein